MQRHKIRIGENEFFIRRYPPFQGLEVLGDLQKRFGAPLLAALDSAEGGLDANVVKVAAAGLSRISAALDGREIVSLAQRVLDPDCVSVSIREGDPVRLTAEAVGRAEMAPDEIVDLCWEVVRHNYEGFIKRFAGRIGQARSRLANPSEDYRTNSPLN